MTHPLQPAELFAQHPRLAELVNALHFRRYPLFLAGLLYVVPLKVTDALLEAFRRLADRHERGFMVEHVMELLAAT